MTAIDTTTEAQRAALLKLFQTYKDDETYFTSREVIRACVEGCAPDSASLPMVGLLRQQIVRLGRLRHALSSVDVAGPGVFYQIKHMPSREAANLEELTAVVSSLAHDSGGVDSNATRGLETGLVTEWLVLDSLAAGAIRRPTAESHRVSSVPLVRTVMRMQFVRADQPRRNPFTALLRLLDGVLARLSLLLMLVLAVLPRAARVRGFVLVLIAVYLRYGLRHEPTEDDAQVLARPPVLTRRGG